MRQNTNSVCAAIRLMETLKAHPDMYGMHYGLLNEHDKWSATLATGQWDNPCTQYGDYSEPQDDPVKAVRAAMKKELTELRDIIKTANDDDQRRICRGLRRAILETLKGGAP